MDRIEILVEEKSMEAFLKIILPKILPSKWMLNQNCFIRSFEGKSDLQKAIPKRVKAYLSFGQKIGIVVLHDQDSSDCKILKSKLSRLITENGKLPFMIRIVCRELESWYLGDLHAIHLAYPDFNYLNYTNKSKYRNPEVCNAAEELRKILPDFQKHRSATKIATHINLDNTKSESFKQFVTGMLKFTS